LKIPDAPKRIYYIGDLSLLNEANNIAIVGARKANLYAKHFTNSLINSLSSYPAVIVSGGAQGIDLTAHVAALENAMPTIIVLGSGILASQFDMNSFFIKKLKETKGSLIISEFEPYAVAQRWTFASRNRLIAALAKSTVIIQAATESGSLITAKYALKYKKKLFAFSAQGLGTNFSGNYELLNSQKAKYLNSAEDLIKEHFSETDTLHAVSSQKKMNEVSELNIDGGNENDENAEIVAMQQSHKIRLKSSEPKTKETACMNNSALTNLLALIDSGVHSFEHLKIKAEINPTTLSMLLSLLEVKGKIGRAINGEFFRIAG
jgi:DNA processing protein